AMSTSAVLTWPRLPLRTLSMYDGYAIAASTPTIATTIINSMRVNPRMRGDPCRPAIVHSRRTSIPPGFLRRDTLPELAPGLATARPGQHERTRVDHHLAFLERRAVHARR